MLLRLKITVYKVKTSAPYILKAPLNDNPYILFISISLNYLRLPLLGQRIEAPLLLFTSPPFYRIFITLYNKSLLLRSLTKP
jgi:hypothetical protein